MEARAKAAWGGMSPQPAVHHVAHCQHRFCWQGLRQQMARHRGGCPKYYVDSALDLSLILRIRERSMFPDLLWGSTHHRRRFPWSDPDLANPLELLSSVLLGRSNTMITVVPPGLLIDRSMRLVVWVLRWVKIAILSIWAALILLLIY